MNEFDKKIFEAEEEKLLKQSGILAAKINLEMLDRLDEDKNIPEPNIQKLNDNFYSMLNQYKRKNIRQKLIRTSVKHIFVFAAVLTVLFTFLFTTVSAFRKTILKLFVEEQVTYSDITTYNEDEAFADTLEFAIMDNTFCVFIGYMPSEFKLYKTSGGLEDIIFQYTSQDGESLNFTISVLPAKISINTEGKIKHPILFSNKTEGIIYESEDDSDTCLIWQDNKFLYYINSPIYSEKIVKIAENIKIEKI